MHPTTRSTSRWLHYVDGFASRSRTSSQNEAAATAFAPPHASIGSCTAVDSRFSIYVMSGSTNSGPAKAIPRFACLDLPRFNYLLYFGSMGRGCYIQLSPKDAIQQVMQNFSQAIPGALDTCTCAENYPNTFVQLRDIQRHYNWPGSTQYPPAVSGTTRSFSPAELWGEGSELCEL